MSAAPERRAGARHEALRLVLVLALAAMVVAAVRPRAADAHRRVRETSEVYPLPPPGQLVHLAFGYRAALADLLWSHVLVTQGLRTGERRRFETVSDYFDAINALDPTFQDPYLHADALITIQVGQTSFEEVKRARAILERGLAARPNDGALWLNAGQFIAYIAPAGMIPDRATRDEWRKVGATYLARAAELGAGDSSISWQALGGASLLKKAGEREAAIRFLHRTLAVTEDEELRREVTAQLRLLVGERERDVHLARKDDFDATWARDLPFVGLTRYLLVGPPRSPFYCAGEPRGRLGCASTFREWSERFEDIAESRALAAPRMQPAPPSPSASSAPAPEPGVSSPPALAPAPAP